MTALKDFVRLESTGLWRASAEDQRRDVYVFVGDASLMIVDSNETPLSHWSLPAVERLNPGQRPALYAPDGNGEETLEIADPDMIEAISRVQRAVRRSTPKPGRLRLILAVAAVLGTVALTVFWLPGALERQARAVIPPAKIDAIGAGLRSDILRLTGPACAGPAGRAELDALLTRLFPADRPKVTILTLDSTPVIVLPGARILVDRKLIETEDTADVLAGYLLAATWMARAHDPVTTFLHHAGTRASIALLTTGDLGLDPIRAEAERLLRQPFDPEPTLPDLAPLFATVGVAMGPYLIHRGVTPPPETPVGPVLDDTRWIALQQFCN